MTLYDIAKTVHIVSVIVWIAGMTVAAMSLRTPSPAALPAITAFDRRVTTPAMLLVWVFGLTIAIQGGWFGQPWLSAKIFLVLILSGLHGMITGRLRRKAWENGSHPDKATRYVFPAGLCLVALVVLLVVTKAI
ncbi:CopD family protein [Rhodobacteraceae bacterium N5(2021)]|uniref:Protoporphyrinogen IX oxidase n=1 Tax=Gymnodinialimonas phycosphaerae TaxID=2841589 RepID=A0A975TTP0_9RHOB|nr:CopD family protein [Gymnodinialimonas phycosphaerae]MBY4894793.1 CopD family protein [Gymnodinialimonas phycosphaerae]